MEAVSRIEASCIASVKSLLWDLCLLHGRVKCLDVRHLTEDECCRRYLMAEPEDNIKLLLEAFQMSVSACTALPTVALLHEQLVGRLMLARKDTQVLHLKHLEEQGVGGASLASISLYDFFKFFTLDWVRRGLSTANKLCNMMREASYICLPAIFVIDFRLLHQASVGCVSGL